MLQVRFYFCLCAFVLLLTGQQRDSMSAVRLLHDAQVAFEAANYDQALEKAQGALGNFPESGLRTGECLLLIGHAFLEKGEFEAAQQQYRSALTIFQNADGKSAQTAKALNGLGECLTKKNDCERAEDFYKKALHIRQSLFGELHESVADSYNNLANCLVQKGRYADALALHQKALGIREKVLPANHPDLATSRNNLGNCYLLSGNYPEALRSFETALRIRQQIFGPDHPKTAQVLNNLGNCYAELGQRSQAVRYYQAALDIRRRHLGPMHPGVATALENIGDLHFDNGDYIAALDAFRQAYGIQQSVHPAGSAPLASLQQKMGLCYQYEGDYDKALTLQLDALKVLSATLGATHPDMAGLFNNLGNCYAGRKDFARAIEYYNNAEKIYRLAGQGPNPDNALLYNNLGIAWLEMNEAQTALIFFKKAEQTLRSVTTAHPDLIISLKNQALAYERMGNAPAALTAFEHALRESAHADPANKVEVWSDYGAMLCRRGMQHNDTTVLRKAVFMLESALAFADSLRLQLTAPASRQRWLEKLYPVHTSAIEACFRLWQQTGETAMLESAFRRAEQSRSLQLLENLHKEQAERSAGVPDSLLEQERYWGEELNRREKNRLSWLGAGALEEARAADAGITEARQQLSALVHYIEQQYPDYYRMKYSIRTAGIETVRRELLGAGNQALVEYFMTDSVLFVFIVTQDVFKGLRLPYDFPLDNWVSDFRNSIQAYPGASGKAAATLSATYAERAYRIFQTVVAPVQAAVQLPENLIIIPDGALSYVPFEALLSEVPADPQQFKRHHYLLRDYRIQYGYSATQLADLQEQPTETASKTVLAVAPDFKNNPYGLKPLQYNRKEAKEVCGMLDGELLDREDATMAAFVAKAPDYRILLLSTHGQASSAAGDLSYLAFAQAQDSSGSAFLYVRDLYLLHFPAELVVLSACETSVGEYRLGEGVISLAKGFFHAGARSIVATLWSVDDAKNAKLIRMFFDCLRTGVRKDEALRDAKLRFLDKVSQDEAHPVYWAAAIANGDMAPMDLPGSGWPWWWMAGGALVLGMLVVFWVWKRKMIT
ncbi:MAG TPA: CHAT domain-containing protein [Saprospiraceae bacterium]|nr:CHAT domain-containing protein [Saprospiraceae bacterium]HPI08672.1 CHAT domain-containing protein [Saprospiraceae bacterium]